MRWLTVLIFFAGLLALGAPPVRAQEKDESYKIWIPLSYVNAVPSDNPYRTMSDGSRFELGDPRLGQWGIDMLKKVERLEKDDLLDWIRVVMMYRTEEAEKALFGASGKMAMKWSLDYYLRRDTFFTTVLIAGKGSESKLKKLLKTQLWTVNYESTRKAGSWIRVQIAARLVTLGDKTGRKYIRDLLYEAMEDQRPTIKTEHRHVADILRQMADKPFIEDIKILLQQMPIGEEHETKRETYTHLVQIMQNNGAELDTLRKIARDDNYTEDHDIYRFYAIKALAERGEVSDIKLLQGIRLWPRVMADENKKLEKARDDAVLTLRCRHWRDL